MVEADGIEEHLRAVGTAKRAEGSKRYLKSDLDFTGATVGDVRKAMKPALAEVRTRDELLELVDALWSRPVFERRLAATFALDARADLLELRDVALIERLVRDSETWALVDVLAGDALGRLVMREPDAARSLDRWAVDDNFWIRRSALLAWLKPLKAGAPLEPFFGYADAMLEEKEFFVRKAIGWVLREAGKDRPEEVAEWLRPRAGRASGVTMREAVKYLAPEEGDALMEAYRAARLRLP
jgi:3-methyladenine DNA glycosylase AlkD